MRPKVLAIFLDRFFGCWAKKLRSFGIGVHYGLRIFLFFSIWFSVFAKNTNGFSDLIPDAVFGSSHLNVSRISAGPGAAMILLPDKAIYLSNCAGFGVSSI